MIYQVIQIIKKGEKQNILIGKEEKRMIIQDLI